MRKLLERSVASVDKRLVLLAPPDIAVPDCFRNVTFDSLRHQQLVQETQRLRGNVYLADGALKPESLSPEGLHRTPEDERSWHLIMLDQQGEVSSCAWYLEHDTTARFEQLRVRTCPLNKIDGWRERLWHAVESELQRARQEQLRYAEVGGWAVAKRSRCTCEGLVLALAAYSLGRTLGGALGITTATVRHSSSTILRRIGGSHLEFEGSAIPPYYDPRYECQMELLRFDSRRPNVKYNGLIEALRRKLAGVPVIARVRHDVEREPFTSAAAPFSSLSVSQSVYAI
jgi:hypothetical protein